MQSRACQGFKEYQLQIIKNAEALAEGLKKRGFNLVSDGTDNHLMLVDLRSKNITGKKAEKLLDSVNITCNKNAIPFDPEKPFVTSGIRLGSAACTTRGMKEEDMDEIAAIIDLVVSDPENEEKKEQAKARVAYLLAKYPLY